MSLTNFTNVQAPVSVWQLIARPDFDFMKDLINVVSIQHTHSYHSKDEGQLKNSHLFLFGTVINQLMLRTSYKIICHGQKKSKYFLSFYILAQNVMVSVTKGFFYGFQINPIGVYPKKCIKCSSGKHLFLIFYSVNSPQSMSWTPCVNNVTESSRLVSYAAIQQ